MTADPWTMLDMSRPRHRQGWPMTVFRSARHCSPPRGVAGQRSQPAGAAGDPSIHAETAAFRNAGRRPITARRSWPPRFRLLVLLRAGAPVQHRCRGDRRRANHRVGPSLAGRERGDVTVLDDDRCFDMLNRFIAEKPHLWNEDIGVAET